MKKLLKTLIIIASIFNFGNVCGSSEITSFKKCSDVWGVVGEFCDVQTLRTLAQVSSNVGAEPQLQLRDIKKWKDNDGLLIAMFGNPTENDRESFRKIPGRYRNFDAYAYQDVLDLLTGFARVELAPADMTALSNKMEAMIHGHVHLTATDREFLGRFMPDKSIKELCNNLGQGCLIGECQCDARFLEDRSAQHRSCVCIRCLSDSDLRRITPRILRGADQIESFETYIHLYMAHIDKKPSSIFLPMKYPNPNLVELLIKSLRAELNSSRLTGSDRVQLSNLFVLLGCWDDADKALLQVVEGSEFVSEYVAMRVMYAMYENVTKPIIRTGRVVCWLAVKFGLVKKD